MRIYFAGEPLNSKNAAPPMDKLLLKRLLSFWDIKKKKLSTLLKLKNENKQTRTA